VIFTVVVTEAPSAVVAVTVIVDGPTGVGVGPDADVQPTSAPAATTSSPSTRYIGARRNCSALCRTPPSIASIPRKHMTMDHMR
jgi:hypothetical protein